MENISVYAGAANARAQVLGQRKAGDREIVLT